MLESGALYTTLASIFMYPSNPNAFEEKRGKTHSLQMGSFGHIGERLLSWNCAMLVSRFSLNSVAPHGYINFERLTPDFIAAKPAIIFSQPWF
jgi:hypothetical protein